MTSTLREFLLILAKPATNRSILVSARFRMIDGSPSDSVKNPAKAVGLTVTDFEVLALIHHLEVMPFDFDIAGGEYPTLASCAAIGSDAIEAVADRGYYSGEEILTCEAAGITVYLPKPLPLTLKTP